MVGAIHQLAKVMMGEVLPIAKAVEAKFCRYYYSTAFHPIEDL